MAAVKHILIRLPNWLGDMVMATAFVKAVQVEYPDAIIDVIAKKGIDFLLDYFPAIEKKYIFSKEKYKGLSGVRTFGKQIRKQLKYDLFFCLPDSLSAAVMCTTIKAKKNIGFKKAMHVIFFTNAYHRKKNVHRVEEYIDLLEQFVGHKISIPAVSLLKEATVLNDALVVNINSEAFSRRLPVSKAVSIINEIRKAITNEIILVGSPKEKPFVDEVYHLLLDKTNVSNIAGKTNLPELINVFASCKAVLSTDSGPAHVSNALGKNTIVLFGAGNEKNTAPYNKINSIVMRLNKLPCEPCVKNICKVYGTPECLLQLDEQLIVHNVITLME
jgi:lipopolysaccharide heptosyltransferase II